MSAARKVRFRTANGKLYECEVRPGATVIVGRDADLTIPEASVSRQHFKIQLTGESFEIIDLGSQNGTELNGHRVARAPLRNGDELTAGKLRLEVEIPPPGARKETGRHLAPKEKALREQFEGMGLKVLERIDHVGTLPVYRARREGLDDIVYVKAVLVGGKEKDAADRAERLVREARLAAKVRHRNVVQIYEVREAAGIVAIVLEPVEGRTLTEEIAAEGKLAAARAFEIGIEICRALVHAHGLGVIHRNVSPGSIMLTPDGSVKLVDFGLAKSVAPGAKGRPITRLGQALGTVEYAPPEQARDASGVDVRADVYALGATLYHALSGEPPVVSFRPEASDDPGAYVPPPIGYVAPDVPQPARAVVGRCMRPNREQRYRTAAELLEAMEGVLTILKPPSVVPWKGAGTNATAFYGRVQGDDLVEFVQMVELNRKSGLLEIYGDLEKGRETVSGTVAFRQGKIVDARTERQAGAAAALELFLLRAGSFCARFGEPPAESAGEELNVSALLMEACRKRDEIAAEGAA